MSYIFKNFCPACGYNLGSPAYYGDPLMPDEAIICSSCGFQPNFTDSAKGYSFQSWRHKWAEEGMPWNSKVIAQPENWSAAAQLKNIGVELDSNNEILEEPEDPDWHKIS